MTIEVKTLKQNIDGEDRQKSDDTLAAYLNNGWTVACEGYDVYTGPGQMPSYRVVRLERRPAQRAEKHDAPLYGAGAYTAAPLSERLTLEARFVQLEKERDELQADYDAVIKQREAARKDADMYRQQAETERALQSATLTQVDLLKGWLAMAVKALNDVFDATDDSVSEQIVKDTLEALAKLNAPVHGWR